MKDVEKVRPGVVYTKVKEAKENLEIKGYEEIGVDYKKNDKKHICGWYLKEPEKEE